MLLIDKRSLNHMNLLYCFLSLLASNENFLDRLCKRLQFRKGLEDKFVENEILNHIRSEMGNWYH